LLVFCNTWPLTQESELTLGEYQMWPPCLRQGMCDQDLSRNGAPAEHSSLTRSLSTDSRVIKSETGSLLEFCKTWPPTRESELTLGMYQMWPSWLRWGTCDKYLSKNGAPSENRAFARSLSTAGSSSQKQGLCSFSAKHGHLLRIELTLGECQMWPSRLR